MKKNFQIGPAILALKLKKGRVLGSGNHSPHGAKVDLFFNHEDDNQSEQILA